ncbi:MAG: hypothetical protein VW946_03765 [Gammaproteobacteria bacterium]
MKKLDYEVPAIMAVVVAISYLVIGFITSVMSGMGNILLIMIYSAVVTFFIGLLLSRDKVTDAQGFSGIVFVISSIVFLHTSAPIWGEKQYCQSQYDARGNNTYSFKYGELREGTGIYKDNNYCISRGGFTYMMENGALQPFLFKASSVIVSISLLILIASHAELIQKNSSPSKPRKKNNKPKHKGIALLEKELLECEKIIADFKKDKKLNLDAKLPKAFFTKLKKLSEMLIYFLEFQSDNEYDTRESRIDKLQIYASKQADQTFKGNKKKIKKIKNELSYTAGQGDYFSQEQVDRWWKKYK